MKKVLFFIAAVSIVSCTKTQFTPNTVSSGSADFSNYIAVGNSLTQGYMDGGVYAYGQSNSFPSDLAAEMKMALPSMNFVQPMTIGNGGGYIHLAYVNGQLAPVQPTDSSYGPNPSAQDPGFPNWGGPAMQANHYNNLGISGITLTGAVALTANEKIVNNVINGWQVISLFGPTPVGNPYGRFMNFGTISAPIQYIDNIRSSKATFFTCWLGDNDALGYATSGGAVNSITVPGFGRIPLDTLTDPAVFAQKYDSILTAFHNLGAKGVCVTIPNVTSIPFFNTVPNNILVNGVPQYLYITTGAGVVRQAVPGDLIILPAYDSVQSGVGFTRSHPLPNSMVLDIDEVASVQNTTIAYNNSIKSLAASFGFGVVDMYSFLGTLQSSLNIDGITFSRTFIQGGTFGLDGVHPNARGYAIVANQMILAINATYGSTLPMVDITQHKSCIFPTW
ncbi:MAG TPA: SGNH/GDSL hydrolase family protein [Bacteroidia bacterium]|nr:SGNH/GDSL hydrolase family protein [Bacteroidia bacterium]